ncbi:ethanolamine utilization protein EutK, partial [Klebsiella pneumoniae]
AGSAAARRTGCVISRRENWSPRKRIPQRLIGGFQPPPPAPMPPADPASSEALLTLLASVRQGMTAGEVAAHFAWPLDKARQALEQLFSAGTLRKRSSRYRLKNP